MNFIYIALFWQKVSRRVLDYYLSYKGDSQSGPNLPTFVKLVGEEIWKQTNFSLKKDNRESDLVRFQQSLQAQTMDLLLKHKEIGRCEKRCLSATHALELLDFIEEISSYKMTAIRKKMAFEGRLK